MSPFQISPHITSVVLKVGKEKTPVIIIDNFISDTGTVIDYVGGHVNFNEEQQTYYPGYRAKISDGYEIFVAETIGARLFEPFSIPRSYRLTVESAYYSLVTKQPADLLPAQRRPHADTSLPYYLAVMHYLSSGEHGGTGFFRHNKTQFEKVTADRVVKYRDSIIEQEGMIVDSRSNSGYITESNYQFELIGEIAYKPNRVIIYPGCLLHSGLINTLTDIRKNPVDGRLTANIFLNFVSDKINRKTFYN